MTDESMVVHSRPQLFSAPDVSPVPWQSEGSAPNPQSALPQSTMSPLSRHLRELGRKVWLGFLIGGLAGAAVYAYKSNVEIGYESTAAVRIIVTDNLTDDGSLTEFQTEQLVELTLAPTVMFEAATRAGLSISSTEALNRIDIDQRATPGFADVRATGPTPEDAQSLAQSTAEVMAEAAATAGVADVELIEPAALPENPEPTNALRDSLLAFAAAGLLALEGAVLLRRSLGRISPIDPSVEVSAITGIPTFDFSVKGKSAGSIPSFFATNLFASPIVTVIQRGKRSTVEMAAALAETATSFNLRVLMIDADTSEPILHQRYGQPQTPGLTEVLAGQAPLRQVVRRASASNPTALVTAGSEQSALSGIDRVVATHQIATAAGADCVVVSTTSQSSLHDVLLVAHHFPQSVVLTLDPKRTTKAQFREFASEVQTVGGQVKAIALHDGKTLDPNSATWRQRRVNRRSHMRKQVARDWTKR